MENNKVKVKPSCQNLTSGTDDPNLDVLFTPEMLRKLKVNNISEKLHNYFHKSNGYFSNFLQKTEKIEQQNWIFISDQSHLKI